MVKIPDLSNTEAQEYGSALIDAGWHIFAVDDVQEDVSGNGNPMFVITFKVADKNDTDYQLSTRYWMTITPKTLPQVKYQLTCMGVNIPEGDFELSGSQLIGRKVKGLIKHEGYVKDGEQRVAAKIQSMQPVSTTPSGEAWATGDKPATDFDDDIPF